MAHNLETNGNEVAFALRGTPAWHNLANRIFNQDEEVSTQLMLDEAKLSNTIFLPNGMILAVLNMFLELIHFQMELMFFLL